MTGDSPTANAFLGESPADNQVTTIQPQVGQSSQFMNGLGAVSATARLASFAKRDNLLVAIAAAIAMDYFGILSHISALGGVC